MNEFSPTPPEETPAIDNEQSASSGEISPAPPEDAPTNQKEQPSPGGFSGKAKRIIALLFVSNILFGVSAFLIWRAGNTRVAALTSVLNSISTARPDDKDREPPVRAADVEGNFTNEMKIPQTAYPDDPPKDDRAFDHPGSPYFYNYDFYNAESTDTLTILPRFRTIQQVKPNSCGLASMLMVMDYYGKLGDWNEETLRELVPKELDENGESLHVGYCLDQLISVFNQIGGFELETTYDYQSDNHWDIMPRLYKEFIEEGVPVIVGSITRGGHWMVVIGYDDMGTADIFYDDVFILADSADYYDHNSDGYTVINAQEYFTNYSFYTLRDLEDHQADLCFIAAKPIEG